jgi:hypothetical protein
MIGGSTGRPVVYWIVVVPKCMYHCTTWIFFIFGRKASTFLTTALTAKVGRCVVVHLCCHNS